MSAKPRPAVVGVLCDVKQVGLLPYHAVGEKYIVALSRCAGLLPVLLPACPGGLGPEEVLSVCDGVFFPGSPSNVHPDRYNGAPPRPDVELDPKRDAYSLSLIRTCVDRAVPLFCVCRGFQELNVAFGGSLHQHLEETAATRGYASRLDHREDKQAELEVRYGPAHDVELVAGGFLDALLAEEVPRRRFRVNSLHGQGIDRLADSARAEAYSEDGVIEALQIVDASAFALGVQWHPEWNCWKDPVSRRMFVAFGQAVRSHGKRREDMGLRLRQDRAGKTRKESP